MDKFRNNIIEILKGNTIDSNSIISLFSNIRNLIDKESSKNNYELVYFFCDWSSHTELDRSIFCKELLDKLSDVWISLSKKENSTNKDFLDEISRNFFSLSRFRDELNNFLINHQLDNSIIKSANNWKNFISVVIFHLCGRPIKRKSAYRFPNEDYIVSFSIINPVDEEDKILKVFASYSNIFHFNIITNQGINLVGMLNYSID